MRPASLVATLLLVGCGPFPQEYVAMKPGDGGQVLMEGAADGGSLALGADAGLTPEVFANSQSTLYRLDPVTRVLSTVGDFSCITLTPDPEDSEDGMADLAVDRLGQMYGIGRAKPDGAWTLLRIDRNTAACSPVARIGELTTGLSFLPAGTVHPTDETLVAVMGVASELKAVSLVTGALTSIAGHVQMSKVADLVAVQGRAFTTGGSVGPSGTETLLGVGFSSSTAQVTELGQFMAAPIAGLGFWAGTLYGFSTEGRLYAIDPVTLVAAEVFIPNRPAGLRFWGAAVTTAAPLTAS